MKGQWSETDTIKFHIASTTSNGKEIETSKNETDKKEIKKETEEEMRK